MERRVEMPYWHHRERKIVLYIELERNRDAKSEWYNLIIGKTHAYLSAKSKLGVLRGLTTVMQLVHGSLQTDNWCKYLRIPAELVIHDSPTYKHRGLLLDTARNYYSVGLWPFPC